MTLAVWQLLCSCYGSLAVGVEHGIIGWLGVAMSSVGCCGGVVTAVEAT